MAPSNSSRLKGLSDGSLTSRVESSDSSSESLGSWLADLNRWATVPLPVPIERINISSERGSVFLTKDPDTDESLAGFRAFNENVQLLCQLFALRPILLRFTGDTVHKIGGHRSNGDRRKDTIKLGDELCFDNFDGDIVDETFQSNLFRNTKRLARSC